MTRPDEPTTDGPTEPTADAVEALVRSIEAKDAGVPMRPVVVVSGAAAGRQPDATEPIPLPSERRQPAPPTPTRPTSATRPAVSRPIRRPITGLVGRLEWERLVDDESERQRRYGRPSAVVLLELHGLDQAAAQSGPAVIARVVPPCGETLVAMARASDRVTRLRDGRFGVLLREADADGAGHFAARAVAACDPWLAAMPWPIELRVGWASPDGAEDLTGALRIAEQRLAAQTTRPHGDLP